MIQAGPSNLSLIVWQNRESMTIKHTVFFTSLTVLSSRFIGLLASELILRVLQIGDGNAPLVSDPVLHHAPPKNYSDPLWSSLSSRLESAE